MERTTTDRDDLLNDLPSDALEPCIPYRPQMVVNLDDLHGTKNRADYFKEIAKIRRDLDKQLALRIERDGYGAVGFTPSHIHPRREKESGLWPMALAALLLQHPQKAGLTCSALLREIADDLGIKPLDKSYMSKKLSKAQHARVREILEQHGYTSPQFRTGTDLRNLVRTRHKQGQPSEPLNVRLKLAAHGDSICIAGKNYTLHRRRAQPKGDRLRDLEIHVGKTRIPVGDLAALLGISEKADCLLTDAA